MAQNQRAKSRSMDDLAKIYKFSKDINESRVMMLVMVDNEHKRGVTINKKRSVRIQNLRVRINKLILMRRDEILKVFSHVKLTRNISPPSSLPSPQPYPSGSVVPRKPTTALPDSKATPSSATTSSSSSSLPSSKRIQLVTSLSQSPVIPMEIVKIDVKDNAAKVCMVPTSFQSNPKVDQTGDDIIYPDGVIDFHPYDIVGRYRKVIGQSTNFREHPLLVAADSTETLILGLEHVAEQHNCILIFSDKDQQFDQSVYRAACGLADLGSIHLLATDSLLTANFQFEIDLDYDSDITSSTENVEEFVLDFCEAISKVLSCDQNNVRVFSIDKLAKKTGRSRVDFGLTTSDQEQTKQLADKLQSRARSGFSNEKILKHVKPGEYECTWKPLLTHLQIRPSDLDPQHNFDYRTPGVPKQDTRGGHPYYLPIDWYRHAVNVSKKYGNDQTWIGRTNAKGEWPVAFHGTKKEAVVGIVQHGLLPSAALKDAMLQEAIEQIGEEANQPGLYVATHCNGGSHPRYTMPFTVTTFPDKSERFRIVFQCRVQPGKFTTHTTPVDVGEAWRIVDQKAVRPYGILVKKEN